MPATARRSTTSWRRSPWRQWQRFMNLAIRNRPARVQLKKPRYASSTKNKQISLERFRTGSVGQFRNGSGLSIVTSTSSTLPTCGPFACRSDDNTYRPSGKCLPRLDREPVKAVSPEWGRSEAKGLDRVAASRRIGVVMAGANGAVLTHEHEHDRTRAREPRSSVPSRLQGWSIEALDHPN
jgi:hypothetical protein